jgi:transposase
MEHDLSFDDVAILIRAKRIQKEKGIKVTSVSDICSIAGISRKTGYKWASQHETEHQDKQEALSGELATLQTTHEELLQNHDELSFQHEGLQLAWKIHRVDEMLASQKKSKHRKKNEE